jgi:RTX calcium-binding nonapeptide repeat (4 copies)
LRLHPTNHLLFARSSHVHEIHPSLHRPASRPFRCPDSGHQVGSPLTDDQLRQLQSGIQSWITQLSSYLSTTTAAQSLPLIGNLTKLVTDEQGNLTSFGQTLSDTITKAINTLQAPTTTQVQSLLNSAFQTANIPVQLSLTATVGGLQLSTVATLGGYFKETLPNDLGLGSLLSLSTPATLQASAGMGVTLTCGVDGKGFYLNTNPGQTAIDLTTNDSLSHTTLRGKLGLVEAHITPNQAGLQADLQLGFGSADSLTTGGLLRMNDFANLTVSHSLSGYVDLSLGVSASVLKTEGKSTVNLLPVSTNLDVSWDLANQYTPDIALTGTTVDLRPLFAQGGEISTILTSVSTLAQQINPVVTTLTTPLLPGTPTSALDLALGASSLTSSQQTAARQFVSLLGGASSFLKDLPTLASAQALRLPDFTVAGFSYTPAPYQPADSLSSYPTLGEIPTNLGKIPSALSSFLDTIKSQGYGTLSLPVLTDPGALAGLFIGQNTTLVDWSLPTLSINNSFTSGSITPIKQIPLSMELQGSVSISENLGIGYDSTGILDYEKGGKASALLDGLYVYNSTGTNASPLSATLSATPIGSLNVSSLAGATLSGSAALSASLLIYPDSLGNAHPFVQGTLVPNVAAKATFQASLGAATQLLGYTTNWTILQPTELGSYLFPSNAPFHGPAENQGTNLQLNVGNNVSLSGQSSAPGGDTLTVNHLLSLVKGSENLSIGLNGVVPSLYTQTGGSLIGSAASGSLTIRETAGVTTPLNFSGGTVNLTYTGGAGNDSIVLGDGNSILTPGTGHDTLVVGNGNNLVRLGLGATTLTAGTNTAISFAPALGSVMVNLNSGVNDGAAKGDLLRGSIVSVTGSSLGDTLIAGSSPVTLIGGGGSDSLAAGNGASTLIGVDPTSPNPGRGEIDTLIAGTGSDLFVLGDVSSVYYASGSLRGGGKGDFALIENYNPALDTLQLHGASSQYFTGILTVNGQQGLGIYFDTANVGRLTPNSELVALLQPVNTLPGGLEDLNAGNPVRQASFLL